LIIRLATEDDAEECERMAKKVKKEVKIDVKVEAP
jgi:hypothetical protein